MEKRREEEEKKWGKRRKEKWVYPSRGRKDSTRLFRKGVETPQLLPDEMNMQNTYETPENNLKPDKLTLTI